MTHFIVTTDPDKTTTEDIDQVFTLFLMRIREDKKTGEDTNLEIYKDLRGLAYRKIRI